MLGNGLILQFMHDTEGTKSSISDMLPKVEITDSVSNCHVSTKFPCNISLVFKIPPGGSVKVYSQVPNTRKGWVIEYFILHTKLQACTIAIDYIVNFIIGSGFSGWWFLCRSIDLFSCDLWVSVRRFDPFILMYWSEGCRKIACKKFCISFVQLGGDDVKL